MTLSGFMDLLQGVKVLDLSVYVAGPYGSMQLADLGAEVVKVEPPTGDPQRELAPFKSGLSTAFAAVNRGKRGIALDLKTEAGRDVLLQLVKKADVLCNNYRPGVMERLGLSFEAVKRHNPRIIYCCLTGFGLTGPRRDTPSYDLAIQALSGGMSLTGYPGSPPARAGLPIADLCGGVYASLGILSALHRRSQTGEATFLDCSLFDTQISMLMYWASVCLNLGIVPPPQEAGNSQVFPYGTYPTSDGWVIVACYGESFWPKLCHAIERDELATDPRFENNSLRVVNKSVLRAILNEVFRQRPSAEWLQTLEENDVPCSPVNNVEQALADPQVAARAMRVKVEAAGGPLELVGNPIKTYPDRPVRPIPPPMLGEHTESVLHEWLNLPKERIDKLIAEGVAVSYAGPVVQA